MNGLVTTLCLLFLVYIQLCDAQESCYQCEYNKEAGKDKECSDPFMFVSPTVSVTACGHGCLKAVTKMDGDVTDVSRGCAKEGCMSSECMEEGEAMKCTYCCNSTECNIAVSLVVNIGLIAGSVFVSILMYTL